MSPQATPQFLNRYTIVGLSATPALVAALLADATPEQLNARPDPDRFTLREVVAHLADWESVWTGRIERIRNEENPALAAPNPGQLALDHDYAHSDFDTQIEAFRAGRAALVATLKAVSETEWSRTARHAQFGEITLADVAHFAWGHDGYHLQQITEYRTQNGDRAAAL